MAHEYLIQLSGSKGFSQIIYFTGLGINACLHPSIEMLGEPYLTRQPFYFLSGMECAARFRIENEELKGKLREINDLDNILNILLDNYLFELSCMDQSTRITSKTKQWRFLNVEVMDDTYQIDGGNAETVIADVLNDESIIECYDIDQGPPGEFYDWLLIEDYFTEVHQEYLSKINKLLTKKIFIKRKTNFDKLECNRKPLISVTSQLFTFEDLKRLDNICHPDTIEQTVKQDTVIITNEDGKSLQVPYYKVECNRIYNHYLLCFYFAGLRENVPQDTFKQFFNIVEYFYEDASLLALRAKSPPDLANSMVTWNNLVSQRRAIANAIGVKERNILSERSMTRYVLTTLITRSEFEEDFMSLGEEVKQYFYEFRYESKNMQIIPLDLHSSNIREIYADRLYSIRCGVVHSKKEYFRDPGACFLPFSYDDALISNEITFLRKIVQRLIKNEINILIGQPLEMGGVARLITLENAWKVRDYGTALDEIPRVMLFASRQSNDVRRLYQDFYSEKIASMLDMERLEKSFDKGWFISKLAPVAALLDADEEMRLYIIVCILLLKGNTWEALSIQYPLLPQRYRQWVCRLITSLQPTFLNKLASDAGLSIDNYYAVMTGELFNADDRAIPALVLIENEGDSPRAVTFDELQRVGEKGGRLDWVKFDENR